MNILFQKLFQKNVSFLLHILLLFAPSCLWARDCQSYLEDKSTSVTGEVLGSDVVTALDSTTQTPVSVGRNIDQLYQALGARNSDNLNAQLLAAEITYSKYFINAFHQAKPSTSPTQLSLMDADEINTLAIQMYRLMRSDLLDRTTSLSNFLARPNLTKDMFLKIPPEIIIDKIGENLTAFAISVDHFYKGQTINEPSDSKYRNIMGVSIITTTVSGLYFFATQQFNETWFYLTGNLGGEMSDPSVKSFLVFLTGGFVSLAATPWFKFKEKRKIRKFQKAAEQARIANPSDSRDLFLYVDTEKGKLKDSIQKITVQVDSATYQPSDGKFDLLTYGTVILNLHKDLVDVFVNDFVRWMKIYDSQSSTIKENLNKIKEGQHVRMGGPKNTLGLMSQIFIEAAEGTRQAIDTSEKIIRTLKIYLEALNSIDQSKLSLTDQLDWTRKARVLNHALIAQTQFSAHLINVYQTLSSILAGLDQILVVESSSSIRRMGEHLNHNQEITQTVDDLLASLDQMDKQLAPLIGSGN